MASNLRSRLFARFYDRATARYELVMRERKRELFQTLSGRVVEIGPGTGANLALFPAGIQWVGIEPNEHMHPILEEKAKGLGFEVDLRALAAEKLPLENDSVDAVVSTLVLCSVPDLDSALREIKRVLRPAGQFYFWEHVIAPEGRALRTLQHILTPIHRALADGCHANRDLGPSIREAGFSSLDLEAFRVPNAAAPAWIRPHISGVAVK
ncbi:MAG: ubiquinone/menaquinone biosynthesis C-methylase UbiE [Planctomycetota bacterium]|jgi:ubiquinone/menaquinone biosynthesis C-methylase UbiE